MTTLLIPPPKCPVHFLSQKWFAQKGPKNRTKFYKALTPRDRTNQRRHSRLKGAVPDQVFKSGKLLVCRYTAVRTPPQKRWDFHVGVKRSGAIKVPFCCIIAAFKRHEKGLLNAAVVEAHARLLLANEQLLRGAYSYPATCRRKCKVCSHEKGA